ncbi:Auxin Efflux Carrier family protein [Histomonas meleagridis]|uniref:Auxin Efflux Carrier family protein n=1 Tax=Histomonas meleagridis TaxID=135588 RepID=UPI0035593DDD|nr:Auxin Efflux Carrier family protein [Histomonas meleagridis]KAH0802758.1 Auxin Efflux Carrier family protein [Histomonas meleagridis]
MTIDYLVALQYVIAPFVMTLVGWIYSILRQMNLTEANDFFKTLIIAVLPGLYFHQVGIQKTRYPYIVLLNEILVEITIHILVGIFCLILPLRDKYKCFLECCITLCSPNNLSCGSAIVYYLFGQDYVYVPIFQSIVQHLILTPIHVFLTYNIINCDTSTSEVTDHKSSTDDDSEPRGDGIDHNDGQPLSNISDEEMNVEHEANLHIMTDSNSHSEAQKVSRGWATFWNFATPINVCTLIGVIWSSTRLTMPPFLEQFVLNLENASFSSYLFIIGVFVQNFSWRCGNTLHTYVYLFASYFVPSFIALFWCWVCGMEKDLTKMIVLTHALPRDIAPFILFCVNKGQFDDIAYTFFWSQFFLVPMQMLWVALINNIVI